MNTYKIPSTFALAINELASERYQDLSLSELDRAGCRVIGGDKGDLYFDGYSLDEDQGMTILSNPRIRTGLELSQMEVLDIAQEILLESFDSIGVECVQA